MSSAIRRSVTSKRRGALLLAAIYALAVVAALGLFVAWRVHVHHASLAARDYFWTGNVHQAGKMGYRLRPEARGMAVLRYGLQDPARRIPVRTDALGLRVPLDDARPRPEPNGIAAIGCSCTFGHGVAAESSYVYLAAQMLGLPAANLGVCGYSGVTSDLLLKDLIGPVHPKYVVYGFGNFHLDRDARLHADSDLWQAYAVCDAQGCRIERPAFDNRLVFSLAPRIEALYGAARLAGGTTPLDVARLRAVLPLAFQDLRRGLAPRAWRLRFAGDALPDTTFCPFLIGDMLATCKAHDATFVLLFFPAFFGETPRPGLQAAVHKYRGDPRFVFVDCSPRLFTGVRDANEYGARWQVPRDGHPNRFMHLEMAKAIVEVLEANGANVPATTSPATAASTAPGPESRP